ncbi:ROK family transcriptional regulator [Microbacterium sp. NPDC055903]
MSVLRRGTNLPRMGDFNQSVVLEAIRRSGDGLSRTELVEATGLSAQTVTNITRRLLDGGLIEEAGRTISGPGKPRTTLRLLPGSRLSIGIHLDPALITVVLLDLGGAVVARSVKRTPKSDPRQVISLMARMVDDLVSSAEADRSAIAGIGVAAPGPLDAARGTVIEPPKLHEWHRVPLRDALAAATRLPVVLEKDTTAAAFAELWTGDDPADVSLLFVYLGIGIGTAIVRDGEVIRGVSRNVGEVGHIMVDPDGRACGCGKRGCVDVSCTPQAIVETAERAGLFAGDRDPDDAGAVDERFAELCARAGAGDRVAQGILEDAVRDLSVLISALANVLDVGRIVLGGPFWNRLSEISMRLLPELLDRQSATRDVRTLPVAGSVVGEDVAAVGAGCVVLADVLAPRASSLLFEAVEIEHGGS